MSGRKRKELSWWLLLGGFVASAAATLALTFLLYVFIRNFNNHYAEILEDNRHLGQQVAALKQPQANSAALRPLSQVADNTPVYARYSDVLALAQGKSASQINVASVIAATTAGQPQWTLLKINGKYFVRGWRYTGKGDYKEYVDWFASTASNTDLQESRELPVERFKNISEPPSIVQDADGTGEEVLLPDAP